MNKLFLNPFIEDDINSLINKLGVFIHTAEIFKCPQTNQDKGLMGLQSMAAAIISLGAEVLNAIKQNRIFVAASLVSQMTEAEIQLLWFDKHYDTNKDDFIDFGYVEQLDMLRVHPERADRVLEQIKQNNCERFLRPNQEEPDLLKRENYYKCWYKDKIRNVSKKYFDDVLEEIKNKMPEVYEYYNGVDVNYENYQLFCGFKHFSTYLVRKCFATEGSFKEDAPVDTKRVVLICALHSLLNMALVLEQHGYNILSVKAVVPEK